MKKTCRVVCGIFTALSTACRSSSQREQQPLVGSRDENPGQKKKVTDNWEHMVTLEKRTGHHFCQRLSSHLWIFLWILASK